MVESRTDALLGLGNGRPSPRIAVKALHGHGIRSCGNHRKLPRFVTQFHICSLGHRCELVKKLPQKQALPGSAGMAELADAADSKSAGTWYLGGSTPPPGTMQPIAAQCFAAGWFLVGFLRMVDCDVTVTFPVSDPRHRRPLASRPRR